MGLDQDSGAPSGVRELEQWHRQKQLEAVESWLLSSSERVKINLGGCMAVSTGALTRKAATVGIPLWRVSPTEELA